MFNIGPQIITLGDCFDIKLRLKYDLKKRREFYTIVWKIDTSTYLGEVPQTKSWVDSRVQAQNRNARLEISAPPPPQKKCAQVCILTTAK